MANQFGQHLPYSRSGLKTCACEAKSVDQTWRGLAPADHRFMVRQITFGTTPGADHMGVPQAGQQFNRAGQHQANGLARRPGAQIIQRIEDDIGARLGPARVKELKRLLSEPWER